MDSRLAIYPERKIAEFICAVQTLALHLENLEKGSEAHICSQKLKNYKKPKVLQNIDDSTFIMGHKFNKTSTNLSQLISDAFENSSLDHPKQGEIFSRLKIGNKAVYTSKIHKRGKNLSYCVEYGNKSDIGLINCFYKVCESTCNAECVTATCTSAKYYAIITKCQKIPLSKDIGLNKFINKLIVLRLSYAIPVSDIVIMCVLINIDSTNYCARRVNLAESE